MQSETITSPRCAILRQGPSRSVPTRKPSSAEERRDNDSDDQGFRTLSAATYCIERADLHYCIVLLYGRIGFHHRVFHRLDASEGVATMREQDRTIG
jgi:hypothetical protein